MSEEFQYQLSVSLPPTEQYAKGDMVNIRGRDAGEFLNNLLNFDVHMAAEAGKVAANIRAQFAIARDMGGEVVSRDSAQNPQNAPQQPYAGQPGGYQREQQSAPQNAPQQFQGGYPQQPQQQGYAPAQGYNSQQPQGGYVNGGGQPTQPVGNGVPSSPPPHVGPAPQCSHGVKQFLAKPYKNGKPGYWMAWACPAQKGDNSQHELEFIPKG